jgi:glycosyltransferase involved in cell wall biosynthesis
MVDVCLVVEGSYPYVTGGVSAWADGLLRAMPDVSFTVAHLRDEDDAAPATAYALPANASLTRVDLDPERLAPPGEARLPEARVYHAACTGAASDLAARSAAETGGAFALTEHGLAWREARFGISACKLAVTGCKLWRRPETVAGALDQALAAYERADAVTSVCGPNVLAQRRMGARGARVLHNPVAAGPARAPRDGGFLAAFVGRVVAIKDVETFLRAAALVAEERPGARFAVVGPTHHEPEYAQSCLDLARELRLDVEFTGETDPRPWFARMDALVLTSLSEAQPLVALEAMAAGVPVVSTDVGGCREAIAGAGLLTPARAPRATADALLRLEADELLRARLGRAGRRITAARHDPARVHGAYRELYERLAA